MIKDSLDAYVAGDVEKAYEVCKRDDEVDDIYKEVFDELLQLMIERSKYSKSSNSIFIYL